MRKIMLCALALTMALALSACGAGDVGGSSVPQSEKSSSQSEPVAEGSYSSDLDGLASKLEFQGYLSNKENQKQKMRADLIGAKEGYKFTKDSLVIELYEYDLSNLNDKAKKCIEEAKSTGNVTVLDSFGAVPATISDNQKYLMLYTDNSKDSDKNPESISRKEAAQKIVKEFE